MRKLLMLAVVVAAAFAVVAAPASAGYTGVRASPNPSFPHDDFDPDNWVAVNAKNGVTEDLCAAPLNWEDPSNCKLNGGDSWELSQLEGDRWSTGTCPTGYEGGFDSSGALTIADGPHGHCWSGGPWPSDYPWHGQTCLNLSTGEAWVRLWAELENLHGTQIYDGEMFGRVDSEGWYDGSIEWGYGMLNLPTYPSWAFWSHGKFFIEQSMLFEGRLDENEEYVPCSWPELQA
jgi:hypothetical protein